jgi:phosphohistidine swiveling domain-containing protein
MNKLLDKYKNFNDAFMKFHALVMDIDAIDICLEEAMKKKFEEVLSKKGNFSKKEFSFKYSLLTNPTELSYINVEEIEVYKLAKELSSVKHIFDEDIPAIIRSIKSKNKYVENKVNKLVNNFWWTTLGWVEKKEKSFEDYIIQIKDIFDSKKDIDKELNRLSGFIKQTKLDQEKLSNELDFDDEIRYYLRLFEKYVVLHDYRKENQVKGTSIMNKFLFELSRRDGLKYDDLSWAWPSEIEEYIKTGKIDLESIRLRKGACLILVSEMGIECLTGEKAIQRRKKELRSDVENVYDFEGIGVSLGKVSGKAKICYSSSDAIKKIEKGDILVASMTLPDYVPAMKKAAAIVTDEGGVTSHAAIVSRELGIPCVSGTKIATRVLKDNDFIEVNANHGRVKILKRA